ncbi:hypothetical protein [Nisaea sp.]|uniref:hypothetical protein n=1 Tax=Nisaea sp. TaxID=2024842 RepID=UPI003299C6B8
MSNIEQLDPAIVRAATESALRGKVKDSDLDKFLDLPTADGHPAPILCEGNITAVLVHSWMHCNPLADYYMKESAWGVGAGVVPAAGGFLYTAYNSWDLFWNETAGYHAQGFADGPGILQFNFFNSSWVPMGQFNAASAGIAWFEFGGSGKWRKKKS